MLPMTEIAVRAVQSAWSDCMCVQAYFNLYSRHGCKRNDKD